MVGTIVSYSNYTNSTHFIKVLSGENLTTLYLTEHPDVRIGDQVEFDERTGKWRLI